MLKHLGMRRFFPQVLQVKIQQNPLQGASQYNHKVLEFAIAEKEIQGDIMIPNYSVGGTRGGLEGATDPTGST